MTVFLTCVAARPAIVCSYLFLLSSFVGVAMNASDREVLDATAAYSAVIIVCCGYILTLEHSCNHRRDKLLSIAVIIMVDVVS